MEPLTVLGIVLQILGGVAALVVTLHERRMRAVETRCEVAEKRLLDSEHMLHAFELDIAKNYATEAQLEKVIDAKLAPINRCLTEILMFLQRQNAGIPLTPTPPG